MKILQHLKGRSSIWSTSGGTLNWVVLHFNPEGWAAFNEKPIIHLITCRYGMKEYLMPVFLPGAAKKWKRKSNSFSKGAGRNGEPLFHHLLQPARKFPYRWIFHCPCVVSRWKKMTKPTIIINKIAEATINFFIIFPLQ